MSLAQKKMVSMGFMVAALIAAITLKEAPFSKLWFVLIMIGLILNVAWLRCPHCGMFLGKYSGERCNACGEKIDWHDKNAKFRGKKENAGEIVDKITNNMVGNTVEDIVKESVEEPAEESKEETVEE